jgi:hypothetical protein
MPDTDIGLGVKDAAPPLSDPTSFVIYPPAGATLYGVEARRTSRNERR